MNVCVGVGGRERERGRERRETGKMINDLFSLTHSIRD